jgi:hypothetical protein
MATRQAGNAVARGALKNPSPQAEGRRTQFRTPAVQGVKENEWPDHKRVMDALLERLKEAKRNLDSQDLDESQYDNAVRAFDDAFRMREVVGAQLQKKRDEAQAAWQKKVDDLKRDPSTYSRRYYEAAQLYASMKDGQLTFDPTSWTELSKPPMFTTGYDGEHAVELATSNYLIDPTVYDFNTIDETVLTEVKYDGENTNVTYDPNQTGDVEGQVQNPLPAAPGLENVGTDDSRSTNRPRLNQGGVARVKYKFDINGDPID